MDISCIRRCCCCIPLRYGLLVWGYIKLIVDLLTLIWYFYVCIMMPRSHQKIVPTVIILFFLADIVLNIIFLAGSHTKNVKALKIFYYYSLVFTGILMGLTLLMLTQSIDDILRVCVYNMYHTFCVDFVVKIVITTSIFFFITGMQCYLILLVRSEIRKLMATCSVKYKSTKVELDTGREKEITEKAVYNKLISTAGDG